MNIFEQKQNINEILLFAHYLSSILVYLVVLNGIISIAIRN